MNPSFNPYHTWLDITAKISRPNYYQLLKINEFEPDTRKVIVAADRALARVRGFKPGDQAAAWSSLLDELAQARVCLADKANKQAYDLALKKRLAQRAEKSNQDSDAQLEVAPVNTTPDLFPPGMAPAGSTPKTAKQKDAARRPSPKTTAAAPSSAKKTTSTASSPKALPKATRNKAVPKKMGTRQTAAPKTGATTGPDSAKKANRPKTRSSPGTKTGPMATVKDHETPAKPTSRSATVNAHVAPPPEPERSMIPLVVGIVAVLGLLTLGMLYLAIGSSW